VGYAQDNYLAFEAHHNMSDGSGTMIVYWPNAPDGSPGCSSNMTWPMLDTITVLGLPSVNTNSVAVLVGLHSCPFPASAMLCKNPLIISFAHSMFLLSLMSGSMSIMAISVWKFGKQVQ